MASDPQSLPALVLFGRLCIIAGEYRAGASVLQIVVGLCDPPAAHAVQLLALLPSVPNTLPPPADLAYARAVAIDCDIDRHADQYVFAQPVRLGRQLEASLLEALRLRPGFARAHAALGNVLMREGRIAEGLSAYARAAALDDADAEMLFGYAERLRLLERTAEAREVFERALALTRTVLQPAAYEEQASALVFYSEDFWERFVAVDLLVDREHVTLQKDYCCASSQPPPGSRVCFNALTDPEDAAALHVIARAAAASGLRCLNDPAQIPKTSRTYLPEHGALHPSLRVPMTARATRAALSAGKLPVAFPFLIRPVSSHRGERLARIQNGAELDAYVESSVEEAFFVTEFLDYRSGDGYYRKYRFIFVDGAAYPHHLAISNQWMVHYFRSLMREHAWMRLEEAAFLHDPSSVFDATQLEALRSLAPEIGLEYFGVDCTILHGEVVVFEANANMLAHDFFGETAFAYKTEPFRALQSAFTALLTNTAERG